MAVGATAEAAEAEVCKHCLKPCDARPPQEHVVEATGITGATGMLLQ
jgi:hypothetical protein